MPKALISVSGIACLASCMTGMVALSFNVVFVCYATVSRQQGLYRSSVEVVHFPFLSVSCPLHSALIPVGFILAIIGNCATFRSSELRSGRLLPFTNLSRNNLRS